MGSNSNGATFVMEDCKLYGGGTKVKGIEFQGSETCRIERTEFHGLQQGLGDAGSVGALTMILWDCAFTDCQSYPISLGLHTGFVDILRVKFIETVNVGNAFITVANSGLSVSVTVSCFQPNSATKAAVNSVGAVRFGNKNCFLQKEDATFSGSGELTIDEVAGYENDYECESCEADVIECAGEGYFNTAGHDLDILGCVWEGRAAQFLWSANGGSLVILECQFLNSGASETDGGILYLIGFSTKVLIGDSIFKGVSGARGNVFIDSATDTASAELEGCTFQYCNNKNGGFLCCGDLSSDSTKVSLSVKNCVFEHGRVTTTTTGAGAGIVCGQSSLVVEECNFLNLSSSVSGDCGNFIIHRVGSGTTRKTDLKKCHFENSNVNAGSPSGICVYDSSPSTASDSTTTVTGCYIHWNFPGT
jgi:hypothetical protein